MAILLLTFLVWVHVNRITVALVEEGLERGWLGRANDGGEAFHYARPGAPAGSLRMDDRK